MNTPLQVDFCQGAHSVSGCLPGKSPCSTLKEQILAKPTISSFSTIHQTDHVNWAGTTVEFLIISAHRNKCLVSQAKHHASSPSGRTVISCVIPGDIFQ